MTFFFLKEGKALPHFFFRQISMEKQTLCNFELAIYLLDFMNILHDRQSDPAEHQIRLSLADTAVPVLVTTN